MQAGRLHTCALTSTGAVRCWGERSKGQLGNGAPLDNALTFTSEQVTGITSGATSLDTLVDHTCAVVSGAVKCWGDNTWGQLGVPSSTANSNVPVSVAGAASGFRAVVTGSDHSCGLTTAGGVKCWGKNDLGQLGDNTTTDSSSAVQVMGLTSGVTSLAAGQYHTCAVVSGAVKCWGGNLYGELGLGNNSSVHVPTEVTGLSQGMVQVTAGDSHTCALTSAGAAYCWGRNGNGQLGNNQGGTLVESTTPQAVVGITSGATVISAGYEFTCALVSGAAKCWGTNFDFELGNGMGPGYESYVPVQVSGLTSGVVGLSAGYSTACARTTAGALWCWGSGQAGNLGNSDTSDSNVPVAVAGFP